MLGDIILHVRGVASTALPETEFSEVVWDGTESQLQSFDNSPKRVCAVQTEFSDPRQISLGKQARHRQLGLLQFVLYEPNGEGDGTQLGIANTIVAGLRTNEKTQAFNTAGDLRFSVNILNPSIANGARQGSSFLRIVRATLRIDFFPHVG